MFIPVINLIIGENERILTRFTRHQISELEKEFHYSKYLCCRRRIELGHSILLSEQQIRSWFQCRRSRWRRNYLSTEVKLQLVDPLTTSSADLIKKQEEEPKRDPI